MKLNKAVITGGCGFLGLNLTNWLISQGCEVLVIDNLSTGKLSNLDTANPLITFLEHDLLKPIPQDLLNGVDIIFHFAANADIRHGMKHSEKDIDQNIVVTERILRSAVEANIKDIVFSSTAAALGEPDIFPTPEDISIPKQTSLYGMSKLAAEGILSAYSANYGLRVSVFRFVSIVGPYYSHGHIIDFVHKLRDNPNTLEILGDGQQRKSYLHVDDMIHAIEIVLKNHNDISSEFFEVYHLGNKEYCKVVESADTICSSLGVNPSYTFTGGKRGWIGDSPFVHLDTSKLRKLGWEPTKNILHSIHETTIWLKDRGEFNS
ncbi:nucleoside-diphosphate sugar epimerase [Candidatus Marinamargulisbacteria bacterium SCGC AG-343-D04]|nr:nucleoside-diphosphate sugar epimerase [Candidatus Marinamargulisbacteria bacterium SCGC AG-343-D04]